MLPGVGLKWQPPGGGLWAHEDLIRFLLELAKIKDSAGSLTVLHPVYSVYCH